MSLHRFLRTDFFDSEVIPLLPLNRYQYTNAHHRLPRLRRLAMAVPARRHSHAGDRHMVRLHDGTLAHADKILVATQRLVHRARREDHGQPDPTRRP